MLPPFPSSGDRGFAPLTYDRIDPSFGTWDDIGRLAEHHDVLLDLMINHISRQSGEFEDFLRHGRDSLYADLFITLDKVWPNGEPPAADVALIFLRKPDAPFSTVSIEDTGREERIWTSFGTADWSEQIDLDVTSGRHATLITRWLRQFAEQGVRIVRLDAVGYVIKKPGTSCFMVEPEIYDFLQWVTDVADSFGLAILPEVHDGHATHERLSAHGFWTYDFVLPGLLLHAFETGQTRAPHRAPRASPDRQFTNLDCHDGIPVRPDLDGILTPVEMADLAERVRAQGGNVNRILSDAHAEAGDVHQLNCTYYSALGEDDERYLAARAIQLFARGFRRSTTSACWRARTTTPPWSERARAARSTATTTRRARSRSRSIDPWSDGSSTWCGFGTRTRLSRATFWSRPRRIPFDSGGNMQRKP